MAYRDPNSTAFSASGNSGDGDRYVTNEAVFKAVDGHEPEVLKAIGIDWPGGSKHITCPYPNHADKHPSWRWDDQERKAFCTCRKAHDIFGVVSGMTGADFAAAKIRVAEAIGRDDLIRTPGQHQAMDAASLLSVPVENRDDHLPVAYLAHRLGVSETEVPKPHTRMVGIKALAYFDAPAGTGDKPRLVGYFPCAVFETIDADDQRHAHRIYLAPGGAGKADLGKRADGEDREPKKSAKVNKGDRITGRAVIWGDPAQAPHLIVAEGIETAAAVALAWWAEIQAGTVAVVSAIDANGVAAIRPWPATRIITVAADRDEGVNEDGRPRDRRGEQAARKLAMARQDQVEVRIALPGEPGTKIDWLNVLRDDGAAAVRAGVDGAEPFVQTDAREDRDREWSGQQRQGHGQGGRRDQRAQSGSHQQHRAGTSSFDKQSKAAREDKEWPDPGDLAPPVPPAPPFPMAALPQVIRDFVADEADRMQAPPDLLAIPALITLAGCIGKDAVIRPKAHDDWAERACLWGMVIQPPGSMKSAAIAKATAPLRYIEARWRKEDAQKQAEWSELKAEALLRDKAWEKDCAQLMKKSEEGYDVELPPKPRAVDELPEEPKPRRLVAQDVTIEKLGDLMIESRGLSLVRDELSGWVLNMSRYNTGSDRQFYLEAYSGGAFAIDRIRRGELYIPDVYINIVGGIQPSVAKNLFSIRDGSDDGFFDRFGLIAFPDLPDDWELVDRWPETGLRQAVNAIADKLASADWAATLYSDADVEAGKAKPYVRFSPAAQEIFNDWLIEHMRGTKAAVDTPIVGFNSKARGLLGRLALVIHLTAWAAGDESDPCTVSELSLGRALTTLEEYLVPMWRRVMAAFSKAPVVDGAHKIAEYIRKKALTGIRVADITKLEWSEFPNRETVETAFRYLVDRDWLAEPEPVPGARGRPSATYLVNPKVHLMSGDDHD